MFDDSIADKLHNKWKVLHDAGDPLVRFEGLAAFIVRQGVYYASTYDDYEFHIFWFDDGSKISFGNDGRYWIDSDERQRRKAKQKKCCAECRDFKKLKAVEGRKERDHDYALAHPDHKCKCVINFANRWLHLRSMRDEPKPYHTILEYVK